MPHRPIRSGSTWELRFQEADRVTDIVDLFERNQAPLLALAAAEAAIVEGESDKARVGEDFRVVAENQRAQARKPVAENDSGAGSGLFIHSRA